MQRPAVFGKADVSLWLALETRMAVFLRSTIPSIDSAAHGRNVNMRVADGSRCKSGTVAPL